jgi:uncharacterized protein
MFLDTSGLFAFFSRQDKHHTAAASRIASAASGLTHNLVLAEFIPLVRSRMLNVDRAIEFVQATLANRRIETVWVDERILTAALNLLRNRRDKTYSLCDAVSFILMRQRGVSEALTTDHHFEQEGFVRLLNG